MHYKSWNELLEKDYGAEQFRKLNYSLHEAKVFFESNTVSEDMKTDYAKILLLKLANLYYINTLDNIEEKSPGLLSNNLTLMNLSEKNLVNAMKKVKTEPNNFTNIAIDERHDVLSCICAIGSYHATGMSGMGVSTSQRVSQTRLVKNIFKYFKDCDYIQNAPAETFYPNKEFSNNYLRKLVPNFMDYFTTINELYKNNPTKLNEHREIQSEITNSILDRCLNDGSLISGQSLGEQKVFFKFILDVQHLPMAKKMMKMYEKQWEIREFVDFQESIATFKKSMEKKGEDTSFFGNILEQIGYNDTGTDKKKSVFEVDLEILDSFVISLNLINLMQYLKKERGLKMGEGALLNSMEIHFTRLKSDGNGTKNLFNLVSGIALQKENKLNGALHINVVMEKNYPLNKEDVKQYISNEVVSFIEGNVEMTKEIAEKITEAKILKKQMEGDLANMGNNLADKKVNKNKF